MPSILKLLLRRASSEKILLALRTAALSLAVAVAAGVFIYLDALGQSALNQMLEGHSQRDLDIAVRGRQASPSYEAHFQLAQSVSDTRVGALQTAFAEPVMAVKSVTLLFDQDVVPWSNARTFIAHVDGIRDAIEIVSGEWHDGNDSRTFQVMISAEDAQYLGLGLHDEIELAVPNQPELVARARITAIYRPERLDSPIWTALDDGLGARSSAFRFAPLIVSEQALAANVPTTLPETEMRYYWIFETDKNALQARDAKKLLDGLDQQETLLRQNLDGFQRITSLDDTLAAFIQNSAISQSLMLAVGSVIAIASLSFAALIAGQAREIRSSESGIIRARGATVSQEILLMTGESLFIALISLAVGTATALIGVSFAGTLPGLRELTGGEPLPASLSPLSIIAALIAAAIGLASLLLPSIIRNLATAQEFSSRLARPPTQSALQKYYLDIVLLVLGVAAMWQLSQEDLFISSSLLGEGFSNRLALAMPAAVAAGGAIAILRFLPFVMSILAEAMSRMPVRLRIPPAVPLALWSLARNPRSSIGLMLLIILATSIAVILAVFSPSLERYTIDAERYRVGSDIRISQMIIRSRARLDQSIQAISRLQGIQFMTSVARTPGTVSAPDGNEAITILGVEPDDFLSSAWWRPDLSPESPDAMLALIEDAQSQGIEIPPDAEWLTAMVKPDTQRPDSGFVARLRDQNGQFHTLTLGNLQPKSVTLGSPFKCPEPELEDPAGETFLPSEWCRIGFGLQNLREEIGPQTRLTLDFIGISQRPIENAPRPTFGSMQIKDISTFSADLHPTTLTIFDDILQSRTASPGFGEFGARIDPASESTEQGAILTWQQPQIGTLKGVRLAKSEPAVKVIGDRWFQDELGTSPGDTLVIHIGSRSVQVQFVAFTEFFPTFPTESAPFIIADIRKVWETVSIDRVDVGELVNELWIAGDDPDGTIQSRIADILQTNNISSRLIQNADLQVERSQLDALTALGWNGYLTFGFVAMSAVAALAFAVNGWTVYRLRRLELAVLKSMGLSTRNMLIMIGLEQSLIAFIAVIIGATFGFILSSVMLPYLAGRDASSLAPPMALDIGWQVLTMLIGIIAAFLIAAIAWVFIWTRTQQTHIVLRAGGAGV